MPVSSMPAPAFFLERVDEVPTTEPGRGAARTARGSLPFLETRVSTILRKGQGMRRASWVLGMLGVAGVASAGLFACSSNTVSPGTLAFGIAESLLVLYPERPSQGYVLLSSGTGTCAAQQAGVAFGQVASLDTVVFPLGLLDAAGKNLPLTAGTYTIVDPSMTLNTAGLFAFGAVVAADGLCNAGESDATSGTLSISAFDTADGGTSNLAYTAVFGATQITGANTLTTCLVSVDAGPFDGGCLDCVFPEDGGACAIQ